MRRLMTDGGVVLLLATAEGSAHDAPAKVLSNDAAGRTRAQTGTIARADGSAVLRPREATAEDD
jgi:hypothetical protein